MFIRLDKTRDMMEGQTDIQNSSGHYSSQHCEQCGRAVKSKGRYKYISKNVSKVQISEQSRCAVVSYSGKKMFSAGVWTVRSWCPVTTARLGQSRYQPLDSRTTGEVLAINHAVGYCLVCARLTVTFQLQNINFRPAGYKVILFGDVTSHYVTKQFEGGLSNC